jgi:hypothetical protein
LKYKNSGVNLTAVFPNGENKKEVKNFLQLYNINIPYFLDKDHKWTNKYSIKVTPEIIILDSLLKVIYQGSIDNRALAPSEIRKVITRKYLEETIISYFAGKEIIDKKTEPVGCFIE